MLTNIPLLFAALLFSTPQAHPVMVSQAQIKSPKLHVIEGGQVVVTLPPHWRIIQRDPESQWQKPLLSGMRGSDQRTVMGTSFSLTARKGVGKTATTGQISVILGTFSESSGRPKVLRLELRGPSLSTNSGIKGCEDINPGESTTQDWCFAAWPSRQTMGVLLLVRIHFHQVRLDRQREFAEFVFRNFRIDNNGINLNRERWSAASHEKPASGSGVYFEAHSSAHL